VGFKASLHAAQKRENSTVVWMKPSLSSRAARRLVARCSQPVGWLKYKKPDKSNLKFYLVTSWTGVLTIIVFK
jgi:hypothetical protein